MVLAYSTALIVLGTFLEWYYYVARFQSDGIAPWLSWIIAIALTVLLAVAVLNRRKTLGRMLMIAVVFYSIINTNAGQEFALSVKEKAEVVSEAREANVQDEIKRLTDRLVAIESENRQVLWERSRSLIGSEETSRRQADLKAERASKEEALHKLREKATTHKATEGKVTNTNVYTFYRDLIAVPEKWLQFFFHLVLSVFIALMVPLGLLALPLPKLRGGFIGWWAKANAEYYAREHKPMPRQMLLAHAKNAGYTEQQFIELEALKVDPSLDAHAMAVLANRRQKEKI